MQNNLFALDFNQLKRSFIVIVLTFVSFQLFASEANVNTNASSQSDQIQSQPVDRPLDSGSVVVVTASRHAKDNALINDFISIEEITIAPASVSELLGQEQGLSVNGQPGLFQTLSIRGLARQRVHAYINGMRITSERRAGVAASFVDPLLLAGAEVTQGPASTYYGSGAIGGSIHLSTRQDDSSWFHTGFGTDGNEQVTAAGTGGQHYNASVAYRSRDNGETVDNKAKNNRFSQYSLFYMHHFEFADYKLDWQFIQSRGTDIGKDNSRFPNNRITIYPEENHWLTQFTLMTDADWVARLYFHDQDLITQELRPEQRVSVVKNDSLDIGFSFDNQWQQGEFKGLYGVDYFGRRGVKSFESETDLQTLLTTSFSSLRDGKENETAIFATLNREYDSWSLHGGLRANHQSQTSQASSRVSDNYFTYFLTGRKKLGEVELSLSYGTGFRFASLSERLFSGTTGRGQTIGNADLEAEQSRSFDFGLDYQAEKYRLSIHRFYTEVDDFIERVEIDDDTRTFRNITNGELLGWQYELTYFPNDVLSIEISGQGIHGEDNFDNPLADIPAKRQQLRLSYDQDNWFGRLSYTRRLAKSAVGDGEFSLDAANIAALKVGYQFINGWSLQFSVENLFDESYFGSQDDLSTLAAGREFSLSVSWN